MNKNDCMEVALILAAANMPEEILNDFFRLDSRIQPLYEGFSESDDMCAQMEARAVELMEEKFGHLWACRRDASREEMHSAREQAAKEIYGDDYHPSLLR
jgi:hypothetical protein